MSHKQWLLEKARPEDSRVYITTLGGNVFVSRLECRTRLFDKSSPTGLHDCYYLAKPQPRERTWEDQRGKKTLLSLTLVSYCGEAFLV